MAKAKAQEGVKTAEQILEELEKKFGLYSVVKQDVKSVSTGSYKLNRATGIGGYPIGKVVEIYGPESSGKSTISLHAIKEFQQAIPDKRVVFMDYEYSFDNNYAANIGVDIESLLIYQPDNQEQGFKLLGGLIEKGLISLAVIDSHTAAAPKGIVEAEIDAATMALQARNNSRFFLKYKGALERNHVTLFGISQLRAAIGSMGEQNAPTGGNAWKFYSDMRLKVWKKNDKDNQLNETTIDIVKNKCEKPFGQAIVDILWGIGLDNYGEIIDMGEECGIIKKAGSWYSYDDGNKLGQGREAVKELFIENEEFFNIVKERVLCRINNPITSSISTIAENVVGISEAVKEGV